jgi:SpoVK/Ycf46/Vps4 family AAA+-type ATPase
MLAAISRPDFVSYMLNNKGKILLIEDAEQVLSIDRNSATNNLLGLTDGFLKDSLDLKVIATMNAPLNQIDPALMRKGRLHFEYKFDKLSADEGQTLVDFLSINKTINESMTLAEIFNEEEVAIKDSFEKRVIGFGAY